MDQSAEPPIADTSAENAYAQPGYTYDLEKAAAFKAKIESQQNLPLAMIGGIAASILGAIIWAVVTVATRHKIGWIAVGVGFLVGITVRKLGRGISKPFGIVGALCALFGCALGNLLSGCGIVAAQEAISIPEVFLNLLLQPSDAVTIFVAMFTPMDFLFYGIALYEGYKFSFREITAEELAALTTPATGRAAEGQPA